MIFLSIDLETTGLDPHSHQIIEFGAVLEDTNNIKPLEELPTYHAYVTHKGGNLTGNVFALNLNAGIIEKLKNQKELANVYNYVKVDDLADDFLFWLHSQGFELFTNYEGTDKEYKSTTINVAGKNFAGFDKQFLNKVPGFSEKIRIRSRVIDPAVLYTNWDSDNALPSLDECKQRANIDGVVTHLAVDDALDVIKLLRPFYTK